MKKRVVIIGGGIVGLATAWRLTQRFPDATVTVLEKEAQVAAHQTGNNSGVLHSGIYYKPGSLRAINCRAGRQAMVEFCEREGIAHDVCSKVIVALTEEQIPAMERIFERGQANGVRCERIGKERLNELEPHCAGIEAIHVPDAGIVNYRQVCVKLSERIAEAGADIRTDARVTGLRCSAAPAVVQSTAGDLEADLVVNCGGLHSDRLAKLSGHPPNAKIVPFRGEYFELEPEAEHLCRNLIYPVPDARFPFLGVHFTRMIEGGVECGPNAVLAFAREGYRKTDINLRDLLESLTYPGFLKLAFKYWKTGCGEMWRSFSKRAFVKALQHLVPEIRVEHLRAAPAGVRAQALGRDGQLVDDFLFVEGDRVINVCNAPSPGATASLNIGALIVDKIAERAECVV